MNVTSSKYLHQTCRSVTNAVSMPVSTIPVYTCCIYYLVYVNRCQALCNPMSMNELMNEWFILKVTPFQSITEMQNIILCSKGTKQSRVIQITITII